MIKKTKGSVEGDHVFVTGPIRDVVTLEDGTEVDLTPNEIEVAHLSPEQVEEIVHHIGMHWFNNGHPDDREIDGIEDSPTFGTFVQRPFDYQPIDRFKHAIKGKKPVGTPHHKPRKG